jgi:hypothetical protein
LNARRIKKLGVIAIIFRKHFLSPGLARLLDVLRQFREHLVCGD